MREDLKLNTALLDISLDKIKYCVVCRSSGFKLFHTPDKPLIKYNPITGQMNETSHELTEKLCVDCATIYCKRDEDTTVVCKPIRNKND